MIRAFCLVFALVSLSVPFGSASAQLENPDPWAIADHSDEQIVRFVGLMPTEAPGGDEAPAILMFKEHAIRVDVASRMVVRNWVVRVKDTAIADYLRQANYLDARGRVERASAFVLRGDAIVSRPEVTITPGETAIERAAVSLDLPALRTGDIVGITTITEFDGILYWEKVSMASALPTAHFSFRLVTNPHHDYLLRSHNADDLHTRNVRQSGGRVTEWHAKMESIPAQPGIALAGPYGPQTPLILVAESREKLGTSGEWVSTLAWQRVALWLSGLRERSIGEMVGAHAKARELVAGIEDPVQKEAALFGFVRDELALLHGSAYDPLAVRSADDILASGEATALETCMMLVAMMSATGLQAELALVRTESWGALDDELRSIVQFSDMAVVGGTAEAPRFHVPYIDGESAGMLPADWGDCEVLWPEPGYMERAAKASAEIQQGVYGDPHEAFMNARKLAETAGWYHLEHVEQAGS